MPDEALNQLPVNDIKAAPNLESELDAALSKQFSPENFKTQTNEEKPVEKEVKPEEKPAVKAEAPVEKSANKAPADDAVSDDETPSSLSPKNKDGWSVLKTNYKKAQRLAEERDVQISELKKTLAEKGTLTQKEVDGLKAQISELSKYRAMVDIQADPEFISKYDQPIEKSIGSIKEMLLGMNVSEDLINQIDFSNTKLMDQIIGHVGEHQDKFIARKLQRKVEDLIDLSDKRNESLAEQKEKYKEYIESKKKENFSKEVEGEGRIYKHLENIAAGKDREGNAKTVPIPFLNKMEPKEGASQPEIEQIENHNRMVDLMANKVQEALKMNSPEDKAELVVAAVASHYFQAQLKAAVSKIKSLETALQKISAVNNESVKAKATTPARNGNSLDLDSALSTHFAGGR